MGRKIGSKNKKKSEQPMKNITINIPDNYEQNIQWLKSNKIISSRSEAIRSALRVFLQKEYGENLDLLEFFKGGNGNV